MMAIFLKLLLLLPLASSIQAGLLGHFIRPNITDKICVSLIALTTIIAFFLTVTLSQADESLFYVSLFPWLTLDQYVVSINIYFDSLTAIMACVVSSVSLLVHIYSIGYMSGDRGYQRFFALVSLFTFMMLTLISADNFLQLFFGWEGVGVVSYLLIGFWFQRDAAADGSLKAFIVNRVGDFGLITGIALLISYSGDLSFSSIPQSLSLLSQHAEFSLLGLTIPGIELACFLLFMGAMAKSAQIPLHVWLPESMEGPTPISALIHAATMVTAGIYMIARLSLIFEHAPMVQNIILILGSVGALSLGLVAIVQTDIKRIVAYSTLSQLGYMACAAAVSSYNIAIFHLSTHAAFKALLFLGCGSVIVALHHEQNIENMGGLARKLPVTYICFLIGSLSLVAIPPLSGFFSKDSILLAVGLSNLPFASVASWLLTLGAAVTAIYSFRLIALVFHGPEMSKHQDVSEPHWTITLPLVILAIPSMLLGYWVLSYTQLLNDLNALFYLTEAHQVAQQTLAASLTNPNSFMLHALEEPTLWLILIASAATLTRYLNYRDVLFSGNIYRVIEWTLINKFGFDLAYNCLVKQCVSTSRCLFNIIDRKLIDQAIIDNLANTAKRQSLWIGQHVSGRLYDYLKYTIYLISLVMIGILFINPWIS